MSASRCSLVDCAIEPTAARSACPALVGGEVIGSPARDTSLLRSRPRSARSITAAVTQAAPVLAPPLRNLAGPSPSTARPISLTMLPNPARSVQEMLIRMVAQSHRTSSAAVRARDRPRPLQGRSTTATATRRPEVHEIVAPPSPRRPPHQRLRRSLGRRGVRHPAPRHGARPRRQGRRDRPRVASTGSRSRRSTRTSPRASASPRCPIMPPTAPRSSGPPTALSTPPRPPAAAACAPPSRRSGPSPNRPRRSSRRSPPPRRARGRRSARARSPRRRCPHPEPLLGDLGDLVAALLDRVLVVEDVALHLQVRAVGRCRRSSARAAAR